jgi:hypothetical protein
MSRWNPRGLSERATLEDLEASSLSMLQQHLGDLTAFQKSTFSGVMPSGGSIGRQIDNIILELEALEAIGPKPIEDAA